jgi:spore maturation protein CgeB
MRDLKDKTVLFIGDLNQGTRSLMRAQKLKNLCGGVLTLSNTPVPFIAGVDKPTVLARVLNKLRLPVDETGINDALRKISRGKWSFDIVWVEKSTMLRPETIRALRDAFPESCLISLSEDDMYALHNRSRYYEKCLPLYDVVFTTKTYNLDELKQLGAKRTEFFLDSYDEELHRPLPEYSTIDKKDIDVSFIGTYEPERASSIRWLGEKGIKVVVFGNGWESVKYDSKKILIKNQAVYGEEYVRTINRTKINLGFLRKINRDQVTSRTMEIAGANSFLLAERTSRHLELFEEGSEAEFFSSESELLTKIESYLSNPGNIISTGNAARNRCILSDYGMSKQIVGILEKLNESIYV